MKHGHGKFQFSSSSFEGEMTNDKLFHGQLLVPSISSSPFFAVFSDGDEFINGFRMYYVTLKTTEDGEIVKIKKKQVQ